MKKIYLAGGCFWGVQHYIRQLKGVIKTTVGYANSKVEYPSYEEVKANKTDSAETVEVIYDENLISLNDLLKMYFLIIDPESIDKQGEDIGHQYRTGIYYEHNDDLDIIDEEIKELKKKYNNIQIEILKLKNFYIAEEYHLNYLINNPQGYCHVSKEMIEFAKNFKK